MSAGSRTELLTVERYTTMPDGGGGFTRTWEVVGRLWAHAQWIGGSETERQGALRPLSRYRFTVLSAAVESLALTTSDRLVWLGEAYNIRERPRRLPRLVETEIIAETGVTDAPVVDVSQGVLKLQLLASDPFMLVLPHPGWMWQDAAGLVPVTADGQPVRRLREQGTRGFIFFSNADGRRPTYRTAGGLHWLEGDGVDDFLSASFAANVSSPWAGVSGWRFLSDQSGGEFSRFLWGGQGSQGAIFRNQGATFRLWGGIPSLEAIVTPDPDTDVDFVATERIGEGLVRLRVDEGPEAQNQATTITHSLFTIYGVGVVPTAPMNARFYGGIRWQGAIPSDSTLSQARTYMAALQGRAL